MQAKKDTYSFSYVLCVYVCKRLIRLIEVLVQQGGVEEWVCNTVYGRG